MQTKKTFSDKLYIFFNILTYIVFANLLMFVTSIFGLVFFTLMPALVALYIMINSLYFKSEYPILKTFFLIFRKEYVRSQKLFMILLIVGFLIGFDIYYFYTRIDGHVINLVFMLVFILLAVIFVLILTHVFPVYIYFPKLNVFETLKMAFLLSLTNLAHSLLYIIGFIATFFLLFYIPLLTALIPIGFFSLLVYAKSFIMNPNFLRLTKDHRPVLVEDYLDGTIDKIYKEEIV